MYEKKFKVKNFGLENAGSKQIFRKNIKSIYSLLFGFSGYLYEILRPKENSFLYFEHRSTLCHAVTFGSPQNGMLSFFK